LVAERIEDFKFNTAITALMEYVNFLTAQGALREDLEILLRLLSPFAPHLAEECWELLGNISFISAAAWPAFSDAAVREKTVKVPVQINGKLRDTLEVQPGHMTAEQLIDLAKTSSKVKKHLENAKILKVIYIPEKILNFVIAQPVGKAPAHLGEARQKRRPKGGQSKESNNGQD